MDSNRYIRLKKYTSVPRESVGNYLSYEIESVDQQENQKTDPNVYADAPIINVKLIEHTPSKLTNQEALTDETLINEALIDDKKIAWGVKAVGADTSPFTGEGIIVAIIDSGIDKLHPAFDGIEFFTKNFTDEGNSDDVTDKMGHGTNSAGTIFGRDVEGKRIGIAPGVEKALIAKVFEENGNSSSEWVINAIQWAFSQGANVISMSLSFNFIIDFQKYKESNLENEALSLTLESCLLNNKLLERITDLFKQQSEVDPRGVILVSAAGNQSNRDKNLKISALPPGNIENIISVAALAKGKNGLEVTNNSNTKVDIAAPGEDILTALASIEREGTLGLRSATSMAAPHVAGVAALWAEKLMKSKRLKSSNLTACILGTATDQELKKEEFDPSDVGAGLVRAPQE